MKNLIILCLVIAIAILLEQTIERINTEALAMAIGVLFGILAGIPTALLMLAVNKRPQPVAEQSRVEIHNHHYGQPTSPPPAIDVVPSAVQLAAQQRGGFPCWDGERWTIVDAAGRRLATQRPRQITINQSETNIDA